MKFAFGHPYQTAEGVFTMEKQMEDAIFKLPLQCADCWSGNGE